MTRLVLDEQPLNVEIARRNPLRVVIDGQTFTITEQTSPGAGACSIAIDGKTFNGWCFTGEREVYVRLNGRTYIIDLAVAGTGKGGQGASANEIRADMPGTVVAVHVAEGDTVSAGQKLLTIESMKLQIAVPAPREGTVAKILVSANTTFDRGAVLVALAARKD